MAWRERKSGRAAGLASKKGGAPPWAALALRTEKHKSLAPSPSFSLFFSLSFSKVELGMDS